MLFFDLEPTDALLGDLNRELVQTFQAIKREPYRVLECIRRLPVGSKAYYRIRAVTPASLSPNEAAARFVYLNRYCFNGIYRTNSQGSFNVPYGTPKEGKNDLPIDAHLVVSASRALQSAKLMCGDFEVTLRQVRRNDFVYLDPPYAVESRRVFREYHPGSFSSRDLERLASALDEIDRRGAKFVITYAHCREAKHLLKRWYQRRITTQRNIAGFVGSRRRAYEVLATNIEKANGNR